MVLTRDHVVQAEQRLGAELPALLVAKLLVRNGEHRRKRGSEWHVFPVWDVSDRTSTSKTYEDIVRQTASAREYHRLPGDAVAIARSTLDDWLVMVPDGSGRLGSQVFLWSSQVGELQPFLDHVGELWEVDDE